MAILIPKEVYALVVWMWLVYLPVLQMEQLLLQVLMGDIATMQGVLHLLPIWVIYGLISIILNS